MACKGRAFPFRQRRAWRLVENHLRRPCGRPCGTTGKRTRQNGTVFRKDSHESGGGGKYASSPLLTRLGYKSRLTFADEEETDGARRADGRSFGNLFHDILADVETASDLERAVRKRAVSGEITPEEARKATGMLAAAMASVESYGWFSGEWRVVNERPIIAAGATKRPDRVMISRDGRRAVVVDYKTGALDDDAYRKNASATAGRWRNTCVCSRKRSGLKARKATYGTFPVARSSLPSQGNDPPPVFGAVFLYTSGISCNFEHQ